MKDARLANQGVANGLRQRELADEFFERPIQRGVHDRKQSGKEIVVRRLGIAAFSDLFAEVCASQADAQKLGGLVGSGSDDGDEGGPAAKLLAAKERNGVADGANFKRAIHHGGIEVAQELKGESRLFADDRFDFREVKRVFQNSA